jgi:molybdate-binding protein/transcriptional regulator with XRE-family HTH domain
MIVSPTNTLALLRRARGWSQAVLADKSGVSRTGVSAIEMGRLVPSVAAALRLAAALGESVETVFGDRREGAAPKWAWEPNASETRCWQAAVNDRILAYPVELTAAGSIPHDRVAFDAGAAARPHRTLVIAGCDPTAGLLAHEMSERHGIRVLPLLRSSAEAVDLLRRGLVHVAGLHVTDASGHPANDISVKSSAGTGYRLIHQMQWDSGIAVGPGRRERNVSALLRANVRWVNREEGSAARRAFDVLLASRPRPSGYRHVVRDHRSVATIVSSGWAEAGMCVKPAAAEAHVRFMPLQTEAYELCVPDGLFGDPRIDALVATLQSISYRALIADVPGCVSRDTGTVRRVA